jgi:hypothetical protein
MDEGELGTITRKRAGWGAKHKKEAQPRVGARRPSLPHAPWKLEGLRLHHHTTAA